MIKSYDIEVTGKGSNEVTKKANNFLIENGISMENVLGISWENPFSASLYYIDNKVEPLKILGVTLEGRSHSISFLADDTITKESKLEFNCDGTHFASVSKIEINKDGNVYATANVLGSWGRSLNTEKASELKSLIGKEITIITDEAALKEIKRMMCAM